MRKIKIPFLLSSVFVSFWGSVPAQAQDAADLVYLVIPVSIGKVASTDLRVEIRDDPDIPDVRCEIRDAESGDVIGSRFLPLTQAESRIWPPSTGEVGEYITANLTLPIPYRPSGQDSDGGFVNGDVYECSFMEGSIIREYAYSHSVFSVNGQLSGLRQ